MTSDIRQGFLSAILAEPHEDANRLAFSDWLKEYGQDHGDEQRGEFIRLQVELATLHLCVAVYPGAVHLVHPSCRGCDRVRVLYPQMEELYYNERGFPEKPPTGWALTLNHLPLDLPMPGVGYLHLRRGFAWAASGPLDVLLRDLPGIMRSQPIETVRVTGKKPSDYTSDVESESHFSWWKEWHRSDSVWNLLAPIWDALDGFLSREELADYVVDNARDYRTEADALSALNRATWKVCRGEAGL